MNDAYLENVRESAQAQCAGEHFYRDSEGNKVDLLLPKVGKLHAVEVKAGATVDHNYFKRLKMFAAH